MEKLFLTETVLIILSIIIAGNSNLILLGDFQNIAPNGSYFNCGNSCNQTWYASQGIIEIANVISQIYTITADMQNGINYQLCQNVSSMEIGKTYKFTFDMMCDRYFIVNCSIWVIINNQVVNGSNYTIYGDDFPHKVVGYFNSTLSTNRICFQSHESPTIINQGARIDNITLQIFNDNAPCNVSGCEYCVLNFPNRCYACQIGYVKQPSQACTNCSTMISNCAQCYYMTNQYTCLQCVSQFSLNLERKFCYRNQPLFFTSEVSETASIGNGFIIKTNLSTDLLNQAGFTNQNLPSIIVQIDSDRQQNLTIALKDQDFLEVRVNIARQYQNFTINFTIEYGFIQINNSYLSIRTSVNKKPSVFMSEMQIAIFQKYDELAKPIIQNLDATFSIMKNSGLGFFITSIFNYLNLMTFYSYLNIQQPKTFRLFIESLSSQLNSYSLYKLINFQNQIYQIAEYQVTEKIQASRQEWLGPLQAGFSTNFYKNNLQPFTIIAIFSIRIALCWILHKIFKATFLHSSKYQRFVSISSQFHTIIPIIILPSFNLIIKSISSRNYAENINTILHIILLFICFVIPFVQLLFQLQQVETKISRDRKKLWIKIKKSKQKGTNGRLRFEIETGNLMNQQVQKQFDQRKNQMNQEEKNRLIQVKFKIVWNLKLLSIPIFVVFQQVLPFLVINLCVLLIGFVLSLKLKKYFSIYEFFLKSIISLAWLLLHCCFCVFFIIQKWFFDQGSTNKILQISKYVSYSSIVIILLGAVVQIIDCLIGIFAAVTKMIIYVYQKYKQSIKIVPQNKKKQQRKNAQSNNIRNSKKFKVGVQQKNKKQSKTELKQKKTEKQVKRQKVNNDRNSCDPVINRELFHLYQFQFCNKNTGISKLDAKKVKKQKANKEQNFCQTAMNRQLFYFQQPQSCKKSTEISNLQKQTKKSQKMKKIKEQIKDHHLKVKFYNQD